MIEADERNRGSGHFCPLADGWRKPEREALLFLRPSSGRTEMSALFTAVGKSGGPLSWRLARKAFPD